MPWTTIEVKAIRLGQPPESCSNDGALVAHVLESNCIPHIVLTPCFAKTLLRRLFRSTRAISQYKGYSAAFQLSAVYLASMETMFVAHTCHRTQAADSLDINLLLTYVTVTLTYQSASARWICTFLCTQTALGRSYLVYFVDIRACHHLVLDSHDHQIKKLLHTARTSEE